MAFQAINKAINSVFERKGLPVMAALAAALFIFETSHALRKRKASRRKRIITNGALAATAAIGLRWVLIPGMVYAAMKTEENKMGITRHLPLPQFFQMLVGFLMVDYGNYFWHRLSHQIPLIWRFHLVHHSDLDLDISTALRFHLGEVLPSAIYRPFIIWLVGLPWKWVLVYELAFEAANNFHHSNIKFPVGVEEQLAKIIVTPAMHGIHHSIVKSETDSNFSVIFNFWDRLHHTLKLNIPQAEIDFGVPSYRNENELLVFNLLKMPFQKQREWLLPDGTTPMRLE